MSQRGRRPVTRARVLGYIQRSRPETVAQIARALEIDRAQVYRILRALYGPNFRAIWHDSAKSDVERVGIPLAA